jgi:hypothetical protein
VPPPRLSPNLPPDSADESRDRAKDCLNQPRNDTDEDAGLDGGGVDGHCYYTPFACPANSHEFRGFAAPPCDGCAFFVSRDWLRPNSPPDDDHLRIGQRSWRVPSTRPCAASSRLERPISR